MIEYVIALEAGEEAPSSTVLAEAEMAELRELACSPESFATEEGGAAEEKAC